MESLYQIRENTIKIFNNYRSLFVIAGKTILGIIMFTLINGLKYASSDFSIITDSSLTFPIIILLGFMFAVLPNTFSFSLVTLYVIVHFSAMLEVAMIIFIFAICVYVFYVRLAPKECIFIILMLIGFKFHLEYAVVLLAGMYFSFTVVIPIAIGTFIWYSLPAFSSVSGAAEVPLTELQSINIMELPQNLSSVMTSLQSDITMNQAWIYYSFVFAMIVILVHAVSRLSIDYSKDIAVFVGSVLNIISIIIISIAASVSVNVFSVIFFTVVSFLIAEIVKFFDVVLDYQGSERLQFEDDENYYHVKVIPKIKLKKKRSVRRTVTEDDEDLYIH